MLKKEDPQMTEARLQHSDSGVDSPEILQADYLWADGKESLLSFFNLQLTIEVSSPSSIEDCRSGIVRDFQNHITDSDKFSITDLSKMIKSKRFWHEIAVMDSEVRPKQICRRRESY